MIGSSVPGAALAALATDLLLGEPPAAVHPTVWMGRWIGAGRRLAARRPRSPREALALGALVVGGGAAVAAMAAFLASSAARRIATHPAAHAGVEGALLKPALSVRALHDAGQEVETALRANDLAEARRLLSWHLVSRDTATLDAAEVAGATIASLAENLGDGVVAPLLAWRAGGLPAAYAYRLVNTADAMLGYRTAELEWLGKVAARTDDALNFVPARLSALLVALAAPAASGSVAAAARVARRDAGRTPSPNGGWPMAAMAGALGVRLDKRAPDGGVLYALNADARAAGADDIRRARHVVLAAALLAALCVEAA